MPVFLESIFPSRLIFKVFFAIYTIMRELKTVTSQAEANSFPSMQVIVRIDLVWDVNDNSS